MKLEPEILKYLRGESLSTGLTVELRKEKYEIISREALITNIIRDKNVIHIGCSDHIQIIKEKIKNNIWLHKLISENAKSCIGIDIDKESIEYIEKEIGFKNVYHGDILTDTFNVISEKKWDYVVFGEIIEHLDNPVNFLKVFKSRYAENVSKFIISVPNIYNKLHFSNMRKYKEVINTDHRFWFTPYTINKVAVSAGYYPDKIIYTNLVKLSKPELTVRKLKYIFHMPVKYPFYYFNKIIIVGSLK